VSTSVERCDWAGTDPLYVAYHDTEWGVPMRDPRRLFELLCLEGAQAGLAWIVPPSTGSIPRAWRPTTTPTATV
jgi:hypothetical protein